MIFVTLGSQKFQFNRLLEKIDALIEQGVIQDSVFAQIGASTYSPKHYEFEAFLDRNAFASKMDECGVVITHGGTGVIIGAVKKGKKVIAVPRLKQYGEHVDDHQLQLLNQFEELQLICACYDMDKLGDCYQEALNTEYREYVSNTDTIIQSIEDFLKENNLIG